MSTKKTSGGGRKQSSDKLSSLASKGLRGEKLTVNQVKSLCGSILSQDETKGKRK